jgi:hypothetical protein
MKSNIHQNRLVIELACESLKSSGSGFANVNRNKDQGTFPDVYATVLDTSSGVEYLVGITGRVETKADGDWDPLFNLVRSEDDRRKARALAERMNKTLAFVAIALRESDGSYAPYFGELDAIGFPRAIPMLPRDRAGYRQLAPYIQDARVEELLAS